MNTCVRLDLRTGQKESGARPITRYAARNHPAFREESVAASCEVCYEELLRSQRPSCRDFYARESSLQIRDSRFVGIISRGFAVPCS
jgi:hypothetical protein